MELKIYKKSAKIWRFIDDDLSDFIPSRFSVNTLNNTVTIVYLDGNKSKTYNVSEVELYNIGSVTPFPIFATAEDLMFKLEELGCPCFFVDGDYVFLPSDWISSDAGNGLEIGTDGKFYASSGGGGSSAWGDLTDFNLLPEATLPLTDQQLAVVEGGITKKANISELSTSNLVTNTNVSGTFIIDYLKDTFDLILTGNTTFIEINLPALEKTKVLSLYVTGNFALTYPDNWTNAIIGTYDGNKLNQIIVEYRSNGKYFVTINQPD